MIYFLLGLIIGILIREIKYESIQLAKKTKELIEIKEKVQFIDAETKEEKLKKSDNIDEFLKKL